MQKILLSLTFLFAVALAWTGCSKSEDPPATQFSVTFDSNGGSAVGAMTINEGAKINKPANPTNGTFIFVGWFKEATWVNEWNFGSDVVSGDMTLYAKWTTVEYTVTFNTDRGSAVAPVKVAEGSQLMAPLTPANDGEAFGGWYSDSELATVYDFSAPVTEDITLYAKWTVITNAALGALIASAREVQRANYTYDSYFIMVTKWDDADDVYKNAVAEQTAIETAYKKLQDAISALVPHPVSEVVSIYMYNMIIDGFIYVPIGEYFSVSAFGVGAQQNDATDSRVSFNYTQTQLDAWVVDVDEIYTIENGITFQTKSDLTDGQTINMTIASKSKPAISKTITLKLISAAGIQARFLSAVNLLPAPAQISHNDKGALDIAEDLSWLLNSAAQQDPVVIAAIEKLYQCREAYDALPTLIGFAFAGNVCTMTEIDDENYKTQMTFVANGAFPQGTYESAWSDAAGDGMYYQYRLNFQADGKGIYAIRYSTSATGEGEPWEPNGEFTYTFTGNKASGGTFLIKYVYDEVSPSPVSKSYLPKTANRPKSIFRR